jgi:glucose-6-phosphate isomerase
MAISQTHELTLSQNIGPHGLSAPALATAEVDVKRALKQLKQQAKDGSLRLLAVPAQRDDLPALLAAARAIKAKAKDIVFLGTGGSSLGGQTVAQLAGYAVPGLGVLRSGPRVHFMDNLDPLTFELFLTKLPLKTARFIAISKSGGTGETLMQAMAAITAMRSAGFTETEIGARFLGLSEPAKPGKNHALRALLAPFAVPFLDHDTGVGGRYSVLTNVGLLPAAILGIDVRALRKGAGISLKATLKAASVEAAPAAMGAALNLAAMRNGKNLAVMMGYSDRFERLARWWVQLWAESLGKGGHGTQPVAALGPVDQHSQQQLYLDGPRDKLFTVLTLGVKGTGYMADSALCKSAGEPGFAGKTIGDLVAAQGLAMIDTFAKRGCAVRRLHQEKLDAQALGELLMHFMLETILTGYAMGIDPFDQPAVEEAKLLAKSYLAEGRG